MSLKQMATLIGAMGALIASAAAFHVHVMLPATLRETAIERRREMAEMIENHARTTHNGAVTRREYDQLKEELGRNHATMERWFERLDAKINARSR